MKLLPAVYILILLASCDTGTDSSQGYEMPLVDTLSVPGDSLAFYFPPNSFSNKPEVDSFIQNWYSSALYNFKEPCLSNGFVGHGIYRFLWLRSFHRPVVFRLQRKNDQVWLTSKILDSHPRFHDDRISGVPKEDQEDYIKEGFFVATTEPDLLVRIADRKADIVFNENISLSGKEWKQFERMLAQADFWKLPTRIEDGSMDGASWVIEAHLKDKYHVVDYHSPDNNDFHKAGLFLITLSGIKEEVY